MVNSVGVRVAVIGSGFAGLGMEVVTDGIREVREHSIVTTDGTEREVDTIIVGTGFQVSEMPAARRLRGFPNLFMLVGPNRAGNATQAR